MAQRAWNQRRERQYPPTLAGNDVYRGLQCGLRSRQRTGGRTRDQLYEEARRRNVKGRSRMTTEQLLEAIGR
jgi:hypothetical protein